MTALVTVIIVTHNSEKVLGKCLKQLCKQTHLPEEIIIVDSGSSNSKYLETYHDVSNIKLIYTDNIGFARANNLGYTKRDSPAHFVLFLNPDCYLQNDFVDKAVSIMTKKKSVGILSGRLLGYDRDSDTPTGYLDSAGIFRNLYGRWYDRGQRQKDCGQFVLEEEVPALCGAAMFCRVEALKAFNNSIFDPDFFLYKEDIELSLRINKYGWRLLYSPELRAYHCRGWKNRADSPYMMRKTAAASEILLYKKHPSPYILWALLKYLAVVCFRL